MRPSAFWLLIFDYLAKISCQSLEQATGCLQNRFIRMWEWSWLVGWQVEICRCSYFIIHPLYVSPPSLSISPPLSPLLRWGILCSLLQRSVFSLWAMFLWLEALINLQALIGKQYFFFFFGWTGSMLWSGLVLCGRLCGVKAMAKRPTPVGLRFRQNRLMRLECTD